MVLRNLFLTTDTTVQFMISTKVLTDGLVIVNALSLWVHGVSGSHINRERLVASTVRTSRTVEKRDIAVAVR